MGRSLTGVSCVLLGVFAVGFAQAATNRLAKITAETTYYDNKQGVAIFTGNVHACDEQYDIHADKAYAFTEGTNGVSRIIAIGHVAMTNGLKRAYGAKVSYHKKNGMVVLHSGNGVMAEVRDASKGEDQVVTGTKIRFWIDSEQVEVINSSISAPVSGAGDFGQQLKGGLK